MRCPEIILLDNKAERGIGLNAGDDLHRGAGISRILRDIRYPIADGGAIVPPLPRRVTVPGRVERIVFMEIGSSHPGYDVPSASGSRVWAQPTNFQRNACVQTWPCRVAAHENIKCEQSPRLTKSPTHPLEF